MRFLRAEFPETLIKYRVGKNVHFVEGISGTRMVADWSTLRESYVRSGFSLVHDSNHFLSRISTQWCTAGSNKKKCLASFPLTSHQDLL